MKSVSRENFAFAVISFVVLLATIFSFTYAFFSANMTASNALNISTGMNVSIVPVFTANASDNLVLTVGDNDMDVSNANNSTTNLTANEVINVSMIGGSTNELASCSFNFKWIDTSTEPYTGSTNRGNLKEYTLKILDDNDMVIFAETNIDSLVSGSNLLNNNLIITSNGVLSSINYNVIVSFYNLNVDQNLQGKKYSGRVVVSNVVC